MRKYITDYRPEDFYRTDWGTSDTYVRPKPLDNIVIGGPPKKEWRQDNEWKQDIEALVVDAPRHDPKLDAMEMIANQFGDEMIRWMNDYGVGPNTYEIEITEVPKVADYMGTDFGPDYEPFHGDIE